MIAGEGKTERWRRGLRKKKEWKRKGGRGRRDIEDKQKRQTTGRQRGQL